jgi:hypothetical protein
VVNLNAVYWSTCSARLADGRSVGCEDVTNIAVQAPGTGSSARATVTSNGQVYITEVPGGGGNNNGAAGVATTVIRPDGATVVVQGGSLVTPEPGATGAAGGAGLTITDERGSIMIVEGGQTGTLTAGLDGSGTALVVGTVTQTSWAADGAISGAGSGGTQPTAQNIAVARKVPVGVVFVAVVLSLWPDSVGLLLLVVMRRYS